MSDDENEEASKCAKCSKVKVRQVLILCDGCDAPYHLVCLKPALSEVPEGDWYCALCEHDSLIKKLRDKLDTIDAHFKELELAKTRSIQKRTNRLADIGANLANMFGNKKKKRHNEDSTGEDGGEEDEEEDEDGVKHSPKKRRNYSVETGEVSSKSFSLFATSEPLGPRSCRAKTRISYTFDDYDRTIKEAVGEHVDEEEVVKGTRRSLRHRAGEFDSNGNSANEDEAEEKASVKSGSSAEFKVKTKKKYVRLLEGKKRLNRLFSSFFLPNIFF